MPTGSRDSMLLPRGRSNLRRCDWAPLFALGSNTTKSPCLQFKGEDNLFCRYSFAHGPDWKIMQVLDTCTCSSRPVQSSFAAPTQGMDHGFSQVALKGSSSDASVVWNLPIDATFKSTNPQGWPRLVVSVYCQARARCVSLSSLPALSPLDFCTPPPTAGSTWPLCSARLREHPYSNCPWPLHPLHPLLHSTCKHNAPVLPRLAHGQHTRGGKGSAVLR